MMMMSIFAVVVVLALVVLAVCRFLGPAFQLWFCSSGEEKIGLSKNKLYNANGYIVSSINDSLWSPAVLAQRCFGRLTLMVKSVVQQVHSGSDILLGSTGSFKRFDSVDRNAHEGELVYGQTTLSTPPWTTDEAIPPQPLRPAPCPLPLSVKTKSRNVSHNFISKQESCDAKPISAPLKSVPRPVARKQLSAPASSCSIPQINPPETGFQKIVKNVTTTTNPFLNGLNTFESIKTNFFSTTIAIENERATQSAFVSKNPFINSSTSSEHDVFDFNPTTIKSIMEETPDDGYLGDNDDNDELDPLKQLEQRIQKIEANNRQRRKSGGSSPPRFSPKILNKPSTSPVIEGSKDSSANEKFVNSSLDDESVAKSYRKHIRNRSLSENETSDLSVFAEQDEFSDQISPVAIASTNPFLNGKRLLKTPSETYLEQFSMLRAHTMNNAANNNNKTPQQLCKHPSLNKIMSSQSLFETSDASSSHLKRAASSESISSDSSVVFTKLERTKPPVTGNLCIALQYDK